MTPSIHTAVLVEESMLVLNVKPGGVYVDCTLGGATHTEELLKRSAPDGQVISFDVDPSAIDRARTRLSAYGERWMPIMANFRHLVSSLEQHGVGAVDGILIDLGFSSDELADPNKGLSFQVEGPLDMRLGEASNDDHLTAAQIVNTWRMPELTDLIREYGEERYARRIADAIIDYRRATPITTTTQLATLIAQSLPPFYERGRIHPATRTFQALRIAVNDELAALKDVIEAAHQVLQPDGVLAIISFHSLEDRVVKHAFKDSSRWNALTKKPIEAGESELQRNARARTAKLRAAKKSYA